MSLSETAELVGTYLKNKHEPTAPSNLESRGYTPKQLEALRKHKTVHKYTALGFRFTNLEHFNFPDIYFAIGAFRAFDENGVLPEVGGYFDQPNKMIEIFDILKALQREEEERMQREVEKDHKRQMRTNGRR